MDGESTDRGLERMALNRQLAITKRNVETVLGDFRWFHIFIVTDKEKAQNLKESRCIILPWGRSVNYTHNLNVEKWQNVRIHICFINWLCSVIGIWVPMGSLQHIASRNGSFCPMENQRPWSLIILMIPIWLRHLNEYACVTLHDYRVILIIHFQQLFLGG